MPIECDKPAKEICFSRWALSWATGQICLAFEFLGYIFALAPVGFRLGGGHFKGSESQGVRGAEPPPPAGRRRTLQNLKKIPKIYYFSIFSKFFKKHALIFRAFARKTQWGGNLWEMFESFWDIFQNNVPWKLQKCRNVVYFSEFFQNTALNFPPFGRKTKRWG